jgi:hypothetical protein
VDRLQQTWRIEWFLNQHAGALPSERFRQFMQVGGQEQDRSIRPHHATQQKQSHTIQSWEGTIGHERIKMAFLHFIEGVDAVNRLMDHETVSNKQRLDHATHASFPVRDQDSFPVRIHDRFSLWALATLLVRRSVHNGEPSREGTSLILFQPQSTSQAEWSVEVAQEKRAPGRSSNRQHCRNSNNG